MRATERALARARLFVCLWFPYAAAPPPPFTDGWREAGRPELSQGALRGVDFSVPLGRDALRGDFANEMLWAAAKRTC